MAALASAVIVSAPQAKTYADTQANDTQAVTEKLIDDQIAKKAQPAEQNNSEKVNAEEKQNQQESSELKEEKEINSKKSGFGSQALNHPAQATAVTGLGNEGLGVSEEKTPPAQQAGEGEGAKEEDKHIQKADDPNYGEDEKKIKDYNSSNRYKETDLQPGDTNQSLVKTDEKVEKDGFKFELKNPSETSPSKTEYGYQITIDKETGHRTYTRIEVTDSGLVKAAPLGEKPMMKEGEKTTPESPKVTYKPSEDTSITAGGQQRNLNYVAEEETLKHINSKDNNSTSFGMKDNYTQDNPAKKFFEGNFIITYKVNPWPNENDKLERLKLNGQYNKKVFVQGQDIDTGIKVDNIDENAKERLVGQVYNPVTNKIVPGASAYIGEDNKIHIKMPEGALKKDANGKTIINEDSIFNTPDYKGIQNLDVKFFARPRTLEEFKTIAETPDDYGETGTYTETGAGSADINHKGSDVKIDKQGIDRYDHYNLIGNFKLNLDDTRYYDQDFKDQEGNKIEEHTSTKVFPGQDFSVEIQDPKIGAEMDGAYSRGEASGKLKGEFLDIANKQIADDLGVDYKEFITSDDYADKRWMIDGKSDNISKFTIRAPKQAKAGDFLALPVEYTYTNGSTDTHWFHFVVKETNNNRPEYLAEVGPQGNTLVNKPIITKSEEDLKKNQPESYELIGNTFKDNKGNVWKVSIDQTTGAVTATLPTNLPEGKEINGGEKLTVPVKVKYTDKDTGKERTEEIKAQFIATKQFKTLTNETKTSEIPYETKVEYDENLPEGYFKETQAGQKGELKITFVQDTLNGKKGIFQQDGTFKEGESKIVVETVKEPTPRIIKIGTKPVETTVEIPKGLDYELDYSKKDGEPEVVEEGNDGVVTIKTTRDPQTGEITVTKTTTTEAKNKKIKIPAGTEGTHEYTEKKPFTYDIQFDPDFYTNYPDAKDNYKIVTEGKVGEKTTKWTIKNSEIVGEPEIIKDTDPTNAVIKVGQRDYTGTITHTEKHEIPFEVEYKYSDELEAGQTKVEQKGEKGSYDVEYSQKIKNGEKDGEATSTKTNEKAAKKEIIVIGTKPVTKVVEKPFNTEYQYDEKLEAGKTEEVTPGKNGKVTITTTYNKETGKVETSETEEKGQNRVVKIGKKPSEGETTKTIERKIPYETKVIYDETLESGTQKIEKEGKPGKEEVTITQKIKDSKPVGEATETTKTITEKEDRVVRIGVKPVVKETELGNNTEYRHNPKLKAGEENVIEEGSKGSVKYTTTFNKETGKLEVTEERTEPKNKVVEYGSKTDGEFKYESEKAYDIIIRENPNLEAGKTKIIQEGKPGKTETTVKIENSKEVSRDTKTITEKQDKIIEIGTKNVCEIPPVKPEDPTKPGKEDPTKPGKEDPTKPGKEDPTKPGKENPANPGKEDSTKPGKEDSTKPGKENPANPGTPGKTPEENGKTPEENGKTPENNGKTPENNGKTPDNSRGDSPNKPNEIPKTPETTEQEKRKEKADTPNRRSANKLPKAGSESEIMMLSMSALMTAAGFIGLKKKRKDR